MTPPLTTFLDLTKNSPMHFCAGILEQLETQNIWTQSFRFAKSTRKGKLSGIRTWIFFCQHFQFPIYPARVKHLVLFLEFNSQTSKYEHLKHLLYCVKYLHMCKDIPFPSGSFDLETTLQGLKRRLCGTVNQVLPITPAILKDIHAKLDLSRSSDLAIWCCFLVTFFCLLRKANSVPEGSDYNVDQILARKHIRFDHQNKMVLIFVGWSKTNQYGNRDLVVPIPSNTDPALDLYRHINNLFSTVQVPDDMPAFSFSYNRFVTYTSFTTRLKSLLKLAGIEPSRYSGHSFRRGGATYLHSLGASALEIQASGDWQTMVFTRYLHLSLEDRWKSQLLMADAISCTSSFV